MTVFFLQNMLCAQDLLKFSSFLSGEPTEVLSLEKEFCENAQIALSNKGIKNISAIFINGNVQLNSDSSFVRVTIEDKNGYEYLILEANTFTIETEEVLNNYFEESVIFYDFEPLQINLQISDAHLYIKNFPYIKHFSQKRNIQKGFEEYRKEFLKQKINKINSNLQKRGFLWYAGETSISNLSYQEKKELFGGNLPNLLGFEYYRGGIYEYPGQKSTYNAMEAKTDPTIVDNFDWRNRHGRNWNTSVKTQINGTCWAYTTCGITEACTNLFFNRKIDPDLSEYSLVACTPFTCSGGGSVALQYVSELGVVDQECFPNGNCNASCSDSCTSPNERIFSNGITFLFPESYSDPELELKKHIIKYGPGFCYLRPLTHAMVFSGFGKINVNDTIVDTTSLYNNIIIQNGDNRIGKTYWILKNSWGIDWGYNGYFYLLADVSTRTMSTPAFLTMPMRSKRYYPFNILCEDRDGDGYYNWGLGNKPSTCPDCAPDDEDGDDSDPMVGPMDELGNLSPITPYIHQGTTIVGTEIWEDTVILCGNLTIENNSSLVITNSGILVMPNHSVIRVKSGAELQVVAARIKNSNIVVEAGGKLRILYGQLMRDFNDEIFIEQGGIFIMDINSSIENIGDSTLY